jgi:hypothetical protein
MSSFKKATRKSAKLRAALCGTSGSGKTYSALLLARGLGERVAVIDTERGSAELYSDLYGFDVAQLEPPFTPARFTALIKEAAAHYDVLIIDSLSHAWAGEGGVLTMHDNAAKADRAGNSYTAWRNVTPEHNKLVDAILNAACHVIVAMRSKTAYEMVDDGKGKKKPLKIGLAPVQRDGMEYEFTLVWDISTDSHVASASKDRTRLWDARNEVITVNHGKELREWLESGAPMEPKPNPLPPPEPETIYGPSSSATVGGDGYSNPAWGNPPEYDFAAAEAAIAAINDVPKLRAWLDTERTRMKWTPTTPAYQAICGVCTERADKLKALAAAPPSPPPPPPPRDVTGKKGRSLNPAPGVPATPESLAAAGYPAGNPEPFNDDLEDL